MSDTFNRHSPQSQTSASHITFVIHPSSGPITLNLNLCLTCASMHHNPPEVHALSLRQPPLDGAVAPADSNSETEPDSGAEDLTTIGKPTMPASDSATEPYCGTKELVNIIKKPDLKLSSVLPSDFSK
ncbi:hypothetical protein K443DRAFT_13188 [Laccaria amethystina LaAM-08-1]|uniref:Uncharacterized protein n=1 Tax=Laccaria amethystina LaAM-08-1 TaxID=1095629 RepID=A0A0C9WW66_9AGAR|nr:hypothetical protein K443DRAFT_13188 [Laccaria amethystina LaAM-08-1]